MMRPSAWPAALGAAILALLLATSCGGSRTGTGAPDGPGASPPAASSGAEPAAQARGATAPAPPQTVAEIAAYQGADRQQILEDGAKAEGHLLIYATGTQIQPLLDRFKETHPYLEVELYRGGSDEIARKAIEEYRAGTFNVDAFELSAVGLLAPREAGVLQPFYSPEAHHYPDEAKEPQGRWVIVRNSYNSLGINTDKVSPAEAPKTYDDLLDPKWKGMMAISGSTSTAANWVGTMLLTKGEDFVRRLGEQDIRVYDMTGRALANLMISGEVAMSPTIYNSHVAESKSKGAHLAWIPLEPVPVTDTAVALAAKAPHPHAALLLIDFLLSKEGQELYKSIGYSSARTDVASEEERFEKLYLSARPDYVQEFEQWVKLYQEVFLHR